MSAAPSCDNASRPSWLASSGPGNRNQHVPPEKWALTLEQMMKFIEACKASPKWSELMASNPNGHISLRDLNEHFVKPWTRGTGNSIALLMNADNPLTASLMISHSWDESVLELEESLKDWSTRNKVPPTTPVWFCLLANYQPGGEEGDDGPTVQEQLKQDPFARVIQSLKEDPNNTFGMVVVHTTTAEVYERLWCVYEIDAALTVGVEVSGAASKQYMLEGIKDLEDLSVSCEDAKCFSPEDERMIRKRVEDSGGFERLDRSIAAFRFSMVQQMYHMQIDSCIVPVVQEASYSPASTQSTCDWSPIPLWNVTSCLSMLTRASSPSLGGMPDEIEDHGPSAEYLGASERTKYPFYVVHVDQVLKMNTLRTHEDLLEAGVLVEWTQGMAFVTFVSHPWLGKEHPDPEAIQLQLLQGFLRRCLGGEQRVMPHHSAEVYDSTQPLEPQELQDQFRDSFIWIDWCCVPQRTGLDQTNAILSAPYYVIQSSRFLVLAPSARHTNGEPRDIRAWGKRGWCRLELLANWLTQMRPPIVLESATIVYSASLATQNIFNSESNFVADGKFMVEADRQALQPVVENVVDFCRAEVLRKGDLTRWRHILTLKKRLVEGSSGVNSEEECSAEQEHRATAATEEQLQKWLGDMFFEDLEDQAGTGHTPLMLAVADGRADIVHALLTRKADPRTTLKEPLPGYHKFSLGWTALHLACWRKQPQVIRLLLDYNVDPLCKDPRGVSALQLAACKGDVTSASMILQHQPKAASVTDKLGTDFWMAAVSLGHVNFFERMKDIRPDAVDLQRANCFDHHLLILAVIDQGNPDMITTLLQAGYDPNQQAQEANMSLPHRLLVYYALYKYKTSQQVGWVYNGLAHTGGSTALHFAAKQGNLPALEVLLKGRADVSLVNSLGQTPLHYAVEHGQISAVEFLLRWRADPEAKDFREETAAEVARRHGHAELELLLGNAIQFALGTELPGPRDSGEIASMALEHGLTEPLVQQLGSVDAETAAEEALGQGLPEFAESLGSADAETSEKLQQSENGDDHNETIVEAGCGQGLREPPPAWLLRPRHPKTSKLSKSEAKKDRGETVGGDQQQGRLRDRFLHQISAVIGCTWVPREVSE
mmetsp:Transcript_82724/g.208143  ORF Transcript_82724/g.208143 Transcript_82724/m.208143 type:complete len:1111 (-) Transcript_82724:461-3793(-)|eukprot:CAMPEP_0115206008 /NCGR_PEP_ID=MMETSP0270-20121206/19981_1 /TAXON_ID=71861 /ORGANISM="Scrippsiella trochoidea, Strain CCMP3099" /LENGTH=1110 /DNA_ID=CAMNT_0002619561 /DNA_START=71 /DNA_END=3403 /DNA_ORIENTATION=-